MNDIHVVYERQSLRSFLAITQILIIYLPLFTAIPHGGHDPSAQPLEDRPLPSASARNPGHGEEPHRIHDEPVPRAQGEGRS